MVCLFVRWCGMTEIHRLLWTQFSILPPFPTLIKYALVGIIYYNETRDVFALMIILWHSNILDNLRIAEKFCQNPKTVDETNL